MRTYDRQDLAELAYHYENRDGFGYVIWESMPKFGVPSTKGSFRGQKQETYYNQGNMQMSKTGYPNEFTYGDETVNYDLAPYGGSFGLSNTDLSQPQNFGKRTSAEMVQEGVNFIASKAKLDLEIRATTFLQTTANYDATLVRDVNAVSTQWSDLNNSDPLVDVQAILEALYGTPNIMRIGAQLMHYLQRHPKLTGSSLVSGKKRTNELDPTITPEYLANYFGIPQVIVSRAIYNSTPNAASMTKGWVWNSAYVYIGYESPDAGDNIAQPSFCHNLYYDAPGFSDMGGFIAKETVDERAGLTGYHNYDVGNWQQFKVRAKMLGGLLTNVI